MAFLYKQRISYVPPCNASFLNLEAPEKKMVATVGESTSVVRLRTKTSLDSLEDAYKTPIKNQVVGHSPSAPPSQSPESGSSLATSFLGIWCATFTGWYGFGFGKPLNLQPIVFHLRLNRSFSSVSVTWMSLSLTSCNFLQSNRPFLWLAQDGKGSPIQAPVIQVIVW